MRRYAWQILLYKTLEFKRQGKALLRVESLIFSAVASKMTLKTITCEARVSLRGNVNITRIALAETLGETMRNGSQNGGQKSIS